MNADIPFGSGSYITGRAVEVAYFLVPNGQTPGGVQKYNLIRRARLAALTSDDAPAYTRRLNDIAAANNPRLEATDPPEVMTAKAMSSPPPPGPPYATFQMFHLNDLTLPANRLVEDWIVLPVNKRPVITNHRIGEDVLLSNVTSFEIKFTGPPATVPVSWPTYVRKADGSPASPVWPRPFSENTDYPYDNLPFNGEFDTFSQNPGQNPPWDDPTNYATVTPNNLTGEMKPIRITGVSIRLRGGISGPSPHAKRRSLWICNNRPWHRSPDR